MFVIIDFHSPTSIYPPKEWVYVAANLQVPFKQKTGAKVKVKYFWDLLKYI